METYKYDLNKECWLKWLMRLSMPYLDCIMILLPCHDLLNMNVKYLCEVKGVISLSSSVGFYSYVAQVWLSVTLVDGLKLLKWFMKLLCSLLMYIV